MSSVSSRTLALVALLSLAPTLAQAQATGAVSGRVRSEGTGAPLSAVVEIRGGGVTRTVVTGPSGRYELGEVPAGRRLVRAHALGYHPFEVEVVVPVDRVMELDIALRAEPVLLDPVRVEAGGGRSPNDTVAVPSAELGLASARVMQSSPGLAEIGLTDAARGSPGQEPVDPSDVLYVRGAGADLKLVYLDGAPVYAPFPLGGLIDPFAPDLLHSAEMYLGGAPARFDGGLSYVLDLRSRGVRADRFHSSGAMDMLAARGVVEAPIGSRGGLLLAGRAVHDVGTGEVARNPLPYGYREGLLRGDLRVGETGVISLTGFRNGEEVWLNASGVRDSVIGWGSSALSLRYRGDLGGVGAELTAALGDFEARLPLVGQRAVVDGWAERRRLAADFVRYADRMTLRYGASFDRQRQGYARSSDTLSRPARIAAAADAAGAYLDLGWQISPRVRVRGGLRADHFSLGNEVALAPRLSATWLITDRAALTLAAGQYHQYLRPTEQGLVSRDLGRSAGNAPDALALGSASHVALSLAQEVGDGVGFGIEGFFKGFGGIPGDDAAAANASGMDVWVRRSEGRWTGWAGYSLAWVWSLPDENQNTRFAGRHLLTSGLGIPVGERGKVDVGFVYGSGLPYAAVPLSLHTAANAPPWSDPALAGGPTRPETNAGAAPLLPEPTRPYLRFDLSASRSWDARWGAGEMTLTPYVRLLNTLGDRDALFYRYDRERDDAPRPLLVLPVVPVLGVEWRF